MAQNTMTKVGANVTLIFVETTPFLKKSYFFFLTLF